jgi:transposase
LADLAKRRLRSKIPALTEALTGRFSEHHAFLARVHLDLIDQHTAAIDDITTRIEETIAPFHWFRDLICTIPGISTLTADVIIAETGADMTRFPTADHLASWAGTTPGNNESAGKVKSSRTRPGNPYLQGAGAPPPCRVPKIQTRTCRRSSFASRLAADHRRPTSQSNTQC